MSQQINIEVFANSLKEKTRSLEKSERVLNKKFESLEAKKNRYNIQRDKVGYMVPKVNDIQAFSEMQTIKLHNLHATLSPNQFARIGQQSPDGAQNKDLSEYADLKSAHSPGISKGEHNAASRLTFNTLEDEDAQEIIVNT